jgi:hypothetical protein
MKKLESLIEPVPEEPLALDHRAPFYKSVLGEMASQGDYLILYDGEKSRSLHSGCAGSESTSYSAKHEKLQYAKEHRVIILDVSICPQVAWEGEWESSIKNHYPEYKDCACLLRLFVLNNPEIKRYRAKLCKPYFHLCYMNQEPVNGCYPCQLITCK